jgi:hypothetical protein
MQQNAETGTRRGGGVVAAVLLELLKLEHFDSYADLADALKSRCARLRIPYDCGEISRAIEQVEAVRGPVIASRLPRRLVEREPEPGIGHDEAAAILRHLGIEL